MVTLIWFLATFAAMTTLAYVAARGMAWAVTFAIAVVVAWGFRMLPGPLWLLLGFAFVLRAPVLLLPRLRRALISDAVLKVYRRVLPAMSQTEQDAIDAGTVWWDAQLFSGEPDWGKLFSYPQPKLSPDEQAFLERETEALCRMT